MIFNPSIRYDNHQLKINSISARQIARDYGTPCYVYSQERLLSNYKHLRAVFSELNAHIHYSVKANSNLAILKSLLDIGAGMDVVSGGELYRVIKAGGSADRIVFAGVGKTREEIQYAIEQGVGWFNVENVAECDYINAVARQLGLYSIKVALRLNPGVTANTHPSIATGHGSAKFGLTEDVVRDILDHQGRYPHISFEGLHLHIGSQLLDIKGTTSALGKMVNIARAYPSVTTLNIGGGIPVVYHPDEPLPDVETFVEAITPFLSGFRVFLEPGRSIIADAGILLTQILYIKEQVGQRFVIVDASMTELIRPALYQSHHEIIPAQENTDTQSSSVHVVGPVCETTDILGEGVMLPSVKPGDILAMMTAGAYGMVMASNYNARPRPLEVMISGDYVTVIRARETWQDLVRAEQKTLFALKK